MERKLYRNEADKVIAGVASGLADYLNIDVTVIRIIFILMAIFGFSGVLIYIILWIAVPKKIIPNFDPNYRMYQDPAGGPAQPYASEVRSKRTGSGRSWAGITLIVIGTIFLFQEFDFLPFWFSFERLWPLVFIIPGVLIISNSRRSSEAGGPVKSETDWNARPATPAEDFPPASTSTTTDQPLAGTSGSTSTGTAGSANPGTSGTTSTGTTGASGGAADQSLNSDQPLT